jgi:hypothetical protein
MSFQSLLPASATEAARLLNALFPGVSPAALHLASTVGSIGWEGQRLSAGCVLVPDENWYVAAAVFNVASTARKLEHVETNVLIALDDIGTKVPRAMAAALRTAGFRPAAIIETSAGNFQVILRLARPVANVPGAELARLQSVLAALAEQGYSDKSVVTDQAHYFRLPGGRNTKSGRANFQVRLVALDPEATIDLEALAAWLHVEQPDSATATATALASRPRFEATLRDPYVRMAAVLGLDPHETSRGVVSAICPNAAAHSPGPEALTGFDFLNRDHCKCHHDSCAEMRSEDHFRIMREKYDTAVDLMLQNGKLTVNEHGELRNHAGALIRRTALEFLDAAEMAINWSGEREQDHPPQNARQPRSSQSEEAVALMKANGWSFFMSDRDEPYAAHGGRVYRLATNHTQLKIGAWIHRNGKLPLSTGKTGLRDLLFAEAFNGAVEPVFGRIGSSGSRYYLNLMNEAGEVVETDADGWRTLHKRDVALRFSDRPFAKPPLPSPARSLEDVNFLQRFRRHVRLPQVIDSTSPQDRGVQTEAKVLMLVLAQLRRDGSVPHAWINGAKGSAKTRFAKRVKQLVDPDVVLTPPLPDVDALASIVHEQTVIVGDNIGERLTEALMDVLSPLSTGTGFQARTLYTNFDRSVVAVKASVILTAIRDDLGERPDFMERTLTITLDPADPAHRRDELELDAAWAAELPFLLGSILDCLVGAIKWEDRVRSYCAGRVMPRLRDAAILAESAARSLGWPEGLCIDALNAAFVDHSERQLLENDVVSGIIRLLDQNGGIFSGTMDELLRALRAVHMDGLALGLPKYPRGLSAALQNLEGAMRDTLGIQMKRWHSRDGAMVAISRHAK